MEKCVADVFDSELFNLAPSVFIARYPHLPWWAIHAFCEMESAHTDVPSGESLLLGMVFLPPVGFRGNEKKLLDTYKDSSLRSFFDTEDKWERWLEHAETCRLARDIVRSGYVRVSERRKYVQGG
jgi:hypothetical protein